MPSLNRVQLIGHLTRKPELRFTPNGKGVCSFAIATSFGSGENKTTEFHECVIWDISEKAPRAKWAAERQQGDLVYAEGRINTRSWNDQEGNKRSKKEIVCDRLDFMRAKGESQSSQNESSLQEVDPLTIPF